MVITRKGTQADIPGILILQDQNLYGKMTAAERENGFVTTPFTPEQIEAIIEQGGLFIAEDKGVIIAYVFAGTWTYFKQWEIFKLMVSRFPLLQFNGQKITVENSFQYGPVCIAKAYRGQGVLQMIFEEMRQELVQRFPIGITFINKVNAISTKAHTQKLGWVIIDEFQFNNNTYLGLGFDMKETVV